MVVSLIITDRELTILQGLTKKKLVECSDSVECNELNSLSDALYIASEIPIFPLNILQNLNLSVNECAVNLNVSNALLLSIVSTAYELTHAQNVLLKQNLTGGVTIYDRNDELIFEIIYEDGKADLSTYNEFKIAMQNAQVWQVLQIKNIFVHDKLRSKGLFKSIVREIFTHSFMDYIVIKNITNKKFKKGLFRICHSSDEASSSVVLNRRAYLNY